MGNTFAYFTVKTFSHTSRLLSAIFTWQLL